jgi:hypothetical protein
MSPRASIDRAEQAVRAAGGTFRQESADIYRASGLCHETQSGSLMFFYHPDEGRLKVYCHAFCEYETILATLGLPRNSLYDEPRGDGTAFVRDMPPRRPKPEPVIFNPAPPGWRPPGDTWMPCGHKKMAEYVYENESERVVYGVARCPQKCLRHWRPVPEFPHRRWKLDELNKNHDVIARTRRVPFRLPQIIEAVQNERVVWICEGEKDALTAAEHLGVASTNSKNWRSDYSRFLEGADVCICADRDPAGERTAKRVVEHLVPVVRSLEVVQAQHGNDLTDHVHNGGTVSSLVTVWTPKPFPIGVA